MSVLCLAMIRYYPLHLEAGAVLQNATSLYWVFIREPDGAGFPPVEHTSTPINQRPRIKLTSGKDANHHHNAYPIPHQENIHPAVRLWTRDEHILRPPHSPKLSQGKHQTQPAAQRPGTRMLTKPGREGPPSEYTTSKGVALYTSSFNIIPTNPRGRGAERATNRTRPGGMMKIPVVWGVPSQRMQGINECRGGSTLGR